MHKNAKKDLAYEKFKEFAPEKSEIKKKYNDTKKTGRPTLYDPKYCEDLKEHMGEGRSFATFAAKLDINVDTLYEWLQKNPDFSDAYKIAKLRHLAWWEDILQKNLITGAGTKFNVVGWIFTVKNRHKEYFSDSLDANISVTPTVTRIVSHDEKEQIELGAKLIEHAKKEGGQ